MFSLFESFRKTKVYLPEILLGDGDKEDLIVIKPEQDSSSL
ncbi:MAG: hypothetical protein U0T69_12905 [Chitinophagales bacterium]